jgi:hypothetical protein
MDETKVSAFLKNMQGGIFQVTKDDTEEDIAMINYCYSNGYLQQTIGGAYRLNDKGHHLIDGKIGFDNSIQSPISINVGHQIYGDVSHSDLSITDALSHSIKPPNIIQHKQSNINIVFKWIISNFWKIVSAFIAGYIVWYFTTKH